MRVCIRKQPDEWDSRESVFQIGGEPSVVGRMVQYRIYVLEQIGVRNLAVVKSLELA